MDSLHDAATLDRSDAAATAFFDSLDDNPACISGGFMIYPSNLLKSAKWSCTAKSLSLKFRHTFCAPVSQHGSGDIFFPLVRSPAGYGRTSH
mmetsp:Transcript_46656/g.129691  ORF Transcript_46656/g.129691 Transcript_46656/m.129691 type:complete len:92 (+) Transcript_46656:162-437(+)